MNIQKIASGLNALKTTPSNARKISEMAQEFNKPILNLSPKLNIAKAKLMEEAKLLEKPDNKAKQVVDGILDKLNHIFKKNKDKTVKCEEIMPELQKAYDGAFSTKSRYQLKTYKPNKSEALKKLEEYSEKAKH